MRYFLDPFGCAKNQVDAEIMMASLNQAGWEVSPRAEGADLIIVNSCGFIESAKRESINAVLLWRKQYPGKKILLAGCLAQRYGAELAESLPEADGLFGNSDLSGIVRAAAGMAGAGGAGGEFSRGEGPAREVPDFLDRPLLGFPGQAYIKISEGCDNRCSFCAIPLIRGPQRCRPVPAIIEECTALLGRGVKELCFIGQDLASYRAEGAALPELAAAVSKLQGNFWARFLYLHPDHFPLELLDIIRDDGRLLPYFDIPFQHASPSVLKAMNRRGDGETYLRLLDKIRQKIPDAVIRSTFLTGFPGETEEEFRFLLDFQEKARFDWLGVFTFSREEGTPAAAMKGRAAKKTALERKARIEETQISITEQRMDRFIGRELDVLVEEEIAAPPVRAGDDTENGGENEPLWLGRLFCHAPEVDGAAVIKGGAAALAESGKAPRPGGLSRCRVTGRAGFDLEVELV